MAPTPNTSAGSPALGHRCALAAVITDLGTWLLPDGDEQVCRLAAQQAVRSARDDFEAFVGTQRRGSEVVLVELTIGGKRSTRQRSVYARVPGPITLLLLAARNCEAGDVVTVRQVTAACGEVRNAARWPFGMPEAEMLTRPADALFAPLADGELDRVHRRERRLGQRRALVIERARGPTSGRLPRLRTWRGGDEHPGRGIALEWRGRRRGVAIRRASATSGAA